MDTMLTLGATETFLTAPDSMFSKNNNYYYSDYDAPLTLKRRYNPWDLDTVFNDETADIYGSPSQPGGLGPYQSLILGHPSFRAEYDVIVCRLLADPLQAAALAQMVTDVETAITPALLLDPNARPHPRHSENPPRFRSSRAKIRLHSATQPYPRENPGKPLITKLRTSSPTDC